MNRGFFINLYVFIRIKVHRVKELISGYFEIQQSDPTTLGIYEYVNKELASALVMGGMSN